MDKKQLAYDAGWKTAIAGLQGVKSEFSDLSTENLADIINRYFKSGSTKLGEDMDYSGFADYINEAYPFKEQDDLFEIDDPINDQLNQQYMSQVEAIFGKFNDAFKSMIGDLDRENLILYKNVMNRWKQVSS